MEIIFAITIPAIILIAVGQIFWTMSSRQQKLDAIGQIKCQRCHHVGKPKMHMDQMTGKESIVCSQCLGEQWEKVT